MRFVISFPLVEDYYWSVNQQEESFDINLLTKHKHYVFIELEISS